MQNAEVRRILDELKEDIKAIIGKWDKWTETHEKEASIFRTLVVRHDEKIKILHKFFWFFLFGLLGTIFYIIRERLL